MEALMKDFDYVKGIPSLKTLRIDFSQRSDLPDLSRGYKSIDEEKVPQTRIRVWNYVQQTLANYYRDSLPNETWPFQCSMDMIMITGLPVSKLDVHNWIFIALLLGGKGKIGLGTARMGARYTRESSESDAVERENPEIKWWDCGDVLGSHDPSYFQHLAKQSYEQLLLRGGLCLGPEVETEPHSCSLCS